MIVEDNSLNNQNNRKLADYLQTQTNGQENLSNEIPVAVYRLMEYSLREELAEQFGKE